MTQKNAPSAVGAAAEGQIVSVPISEENPNMDIIADTTDNREDEGETLAEWNARDKAERAAWLVEHPEADAAKPDWATKVGVEWEPDGAHSITYDREFGHVLLSRWAVWDHGTVRFMAGTTDPEVVVVLRDEVLTVTQMRELASALMAAIPVVEAAHA